MLNNKRAWAKGLLLIILIVSIGKSLLTIIKTNHTVSNEVVPVKWEKFTENVVGDDEFQLTKDIMTNSTNYILSTWYEENNYDLKGGPVEFESRHELHIRGPAMAVLGLAVPLATRQYDSEKIGVSSDEAIKRTVFLIDSLSRSHYSNDAFGWGYDDNPNAYNWQTPLWSYYVGFSGWLLWDHLNTDEQENVRRMVEWEANNIPEPRYYKDDEGKVLYDGDTQAEENSSWVSLLALASSMMPRHENTQAWMDQMIDLSLAAFAKPSDTVSEEQYNNRILGEFLKGSNIEENGTAINHGFLHPIYMLTIEQNLNAALLLSLAEFKVPKAVLHNSDNIYYALTDLTFNPDEYLNPGGTIYREGTSDIYYPEGNDWGEYFPMYFGQLDVLAGIFNFDNKSGYDASYWSKLHNEGQLQLQNRFEDGRTYKNEIESNYNLKEERIAQIASSTFLAKWLEEQEAYNFSEESFHHFSRMHKPFQKTLVIFGTTTGISLGLLFIINKKEG